MKAIILAAGYGNRMKPLTDTTHKTMLKIGGETIIERIIDGLTSNGVQDIVVVIGYKAETLKQFLTECYPLVQFQFITNDRYMETNNIYSLALAFEEISFDKDIIIIESDLIFEPAVISKLFESKYANTALVDKYRSGMDGTVVSVAEGVITNVIPPHLQDQHFNFSDKYKTLNIYKFSKEFCADEFKKMLTYYANIIDDNCYYELILGILIYMKRETIHAEILDGEKWAEVDDPNDLRIAEFIFDPSKKLDILTKSCGGYWGHDILDFCFIRNMYFPSNAMLSELRNNLPELLCNYGSSQEMLDEKLAYYLLCSEDRVQVLNGSSQVFPLLRQWFRGKKALLPDPTFGEYPSAFPEAVLYKDAVGIDIQDIEAKTPLCDIVVFVNPNNPTGSVLPTQWIFEFAEQQPDKTIIVDESFIEFSDQPSIIYLLEKQPLDNILVIKSLSKVLGVPGIRLGYVYCCDPAVNMKLRQETPIWNLNSLAENLMEIILKHRKTVSKSYMQTKKDREQFAEKLLQVPVIDCVFPSGANFLLVKLKPSAGKTDIVKQMLANYNVLIKEVSHKFNDEFVYLRFAVRRPVENDFLIACLHHCYGA